MGRDEPAREDVGLRRKAATLALVIALIALVVGAAFGDGGILHMLAERERGESLRRELEELRAENSRLAAEIRALRSDPAAIERLAREQLGLAHPGETVFLLRPEAATGP